MLQKEEELRLIQSKAAEMEDELHTALQEKQVSITLQCNQLTVTIRTAIPSSSCHTFAYEKEERVRSGVIQMTLFVMILCILITCLLGNG